MLPAARAGFAVTAIALGAAITASAAPAAAQSNPYRQVEAPMPPADMDGGEWGEMIQVRLDPEGNR